MTSGSGPFPNIDNTLRILGGHPELVGRIWFDDFYDRMYSDLWGGVKEWADEHDVMLTAWIQRNVNMPKLNKTTVRDAVDQWSRINIRNEPRDWMESLVWDKTERLPTLMADAFGALQDDYSAAVGRCWMTSMVARTYLPGCKVDTMPVFEGPQGRGKSTALSIIGGKWFAEMHEDMTTKDFLQNLPGKLLVEISEMHSFNRAEIDRIKGIISCATDRYRPSYGRRSIDHPRRGVWAGTTNRDDWIRDDTGARRFWPIACGEINLNYLREQREQLFAEARCLFQAGKPWWDIDHVLATSEQNKRRDIDEWQEYILPWCASREYVNVGEILTFVLEITPDRQGRSEQMRVASILRSNGFKKHDKWENGKVLKRWRTPDNLYSGKGGKTEPLF